MSDAGRKMDVEDVLSSIRRLVSEEARTVSEGITPKSQSVEQVQKPKQAATPVIELPEKLVLTPEFRVSEPTPQATIAAEIEARIASFEAPIEDKASFTPPSEELPPPPETHTIGSPIAEAPFEEVVQPTSLEPEPTTDPEPQETDQTLAVEPELSTPLKEEMEAPEPEAEAPPIEVIEPETAPSAPIYGHEEVDYTAETEADSYLDEEALRELVSEMVRSELQGELGDRITRNVRKLVRREIHRALASREFE